MAGVRQWWVCQCGRVTQISSVQAWHVYGYDKSTCVCLVRHKSPGVGDIQKWWVKRCGKCSRTERCVKFSYVTCIENV